MDALDKMDIHGASLLRNMENRFVELANKIMVDRPKPLIYTLITKIMDEIGAVGKGRNAPANAGGYAFRGIDEMYNAIQPALIKHSVFYTPKLLKVDRRDRNFSGGKGGVETLVTMEYTFFASDGSYLPPIVTIGEAMDIGDKSCNKAMSTALKYALMELFCIPTVEAKDSENDHYELAGQGQGQPNKPKDQSGGQRQPPAGQNTQAGPPGEFVMNFTKGFKGKKLKDIPRSALEDQTREDQSINEGLITWCKKNKRFPDFVAAAEAWLKILGPKKEEPVDPPAPEPTDQREPGDEEMPPFDQFEQP